MTIHLVSGFLGSGKTTAIRQACLELQDRGKQIGVITNDQGVRLIDAKFFRQSGIPERQVGNGCFCCNYTDLDNRIESLVEEHHPDIIFAESVGSCTDIVATVMKPLRKQHKGMRITVSTIVDTRLLHMLINEEEKIFEENVKYIFFRQIEEAEIIVLTKTDLAGIRLILDVKKFLTKQFDSKKIIFQNSLSGESSEWLKILSHHPSDPFIASLNIDYGKYASGEAHLGYADQEIVITGNLNAEEAAIGLIKNFAEKIKHISATIGHLKFWMNERCKISFTSTGLDDISRIDIQKNNRCDLMVNARVQMNPQKLNEMWQDALQETISKYNISISGSPVSFFKPGYPRPLHRIA
jgi:G3E family GTPase